MTTDETLASNVKRFRKLMKMTQRDLGVRLLSATGGSTEKNIPANLISKVEKVERKVSAVELYELSAIFGCTMGDLMGTDETRDPLAAQLKAAVEDAIESVMGGAA